MLKIFGHMAPDTDATCSAIIWAWYIGTQGNDATPYVLGVPNSEAKFVLNRWGVAEPEFLEDVTAEDRVIIVDTNNPAELPPSINDAQIQEIIDHHLLVGGLKTKHPINITMEPLASTATIMARMMGPDLKAAPEPIKGLVLSCILSDTLEFRSPTTTVVDREIAAELAKDLGLDISTYAAEMFAAKSDVSGYSDAELLRLDSKKYDAGGKSFRVSVLETTSPATVLERKSSLVSTMETVAAEDSVDQVLLFVIDILNEEATLITPNELSKQVAKASFDATADGDTVVLPGIVSRKKQIIPNLKV